MTWSHGAHLTNCSHLTVHAARGTSVDAQEDVLPTATTPTSSIARRWHSPRTRAPKRHRSFGAVPTRTGRHTDAFGAASTTTWQLDIRCRDSVLSFGAPWRLLVGPL